MTYFHDRYWIIALTLLKLGRPRDIEKSPCKTLRVAHGTQYARLTRDNNTKASVFTWLEFHFIRENVEIIEIPRLSAIRITFRYSRRDDLHEHAHLIVTNALIAVYIRVGQQGRQVTLFVTKIGPFFSTRLLGEDSAKPLRSTFAFCYIDLRALLRMFFSCNCSLHRSAEQSFAELNSDCISYVTSSTLKQMHIDLRASIPLMAILCFAGEIDRALNRKKKMIEGTVT